MSGIDDKKRLPLHTCENCYRDFRSRTWSCPYCGHNSRSMDGEWLKRMKSSKKQNGHGRGYLPLIEDIKQKGDLPLLADCKR